MSVDGPSAYTVERLAAVLGYSPQHLFTIARRIDRYGYTPFPLCKPSKKRVIAAPVDWLRSVQRGLLDRVLTDIPLADCVYSRRGRSVEQGARQHLQRDHMLVVDIQDCFPSTTLQMVHAGLRRVRFPDPVARLIARLVTHNGRLPQGPPTSPSILNLVLGELDEDLMVLAEREGAIYTRYIDDLCFSGDSALRTLRRRVVRLLRARGYEASVGKTREYGPDELHVVTNIVVGASLNAPPEYLSPLADTIRKYRRGASAITSASIIGQINWVRRLNPDEASCLDVQFGAAQRSRSKLRGNAS